MFEISLTDNEKVAKQASQSPHLRIIHNSCKDRHKGVIGAHWSCG